MDVGGEEGVGPGDGGAHRLVARWLVAAADGEEGERVVEAGQDRRHWQVGEAGGGEFERQRQAVEASAEGGHVGRVLLRQGESGAGRPRP
ncbi:MAG: hypothetical protein ACRDJ9_08835, partial [Dehalococcoidia bacterium]